MLKKLHSGKGLIVALLLVLSSVCSLLMSSVASATSDYDDVFDVATAARVSDTYDNHTCTAQDIAASWGSYLMDDSKWSHAVSASGAGRETVQSALATALENGDGWAVTEREFVTDTSIGNFVWSSGDYGVQVMFTPDADNEATFFTHSGLDYATLKGTGSAPVYVVILGQYWNSSTSSCSIGVAVSRTVASDASNSTFLSKEAYVGHSNPNPNWLNIYQQLFVNSPVVYPVGYEGEELVPLDLSTDADEDNLVIGYETAQGTSDNNEDADGDGIDDLKESVRFENRDNVFCGTSCAYPDPLTKDIYVELDWMDSGTTEYKPTSTQLGLVEDSLDDQGHNVHIDTGQYGGGNELSEYIQYLPFAYDATPVGFFDLKNGNVGESIAASFDSNREGIWRYMIAGYGYDEDHASSGASYAGSGNVFISVGKIQDNQSVFGYTNVNTAIAGTIVHELGHSLCMSQQQSYSYQSTDCRYSGVDSYATTTYDSVLNYNLQMFQTTLSDGSNGTGDHNDWGAIDGGGIADFSQWDTSAMNFQPGVGKKKTKPSKIAMKKGITIEQAQAAKRNGTLGIVTRDGKVYDLKKKDANGIPPAVHH